METKKGRLYIFVNLRPNDIINRLCNLANLLMQLITESNNLCTAFFDNFHFLFNSLIRSLSCFDFCRLGSLLIVQYSLLIRCEADLQTLVKQI